jgi:hypothetical protein
VTGLTIADSAFLAAAAGFSPLSLSAELWLDAADTTTLTVSGSAVSQWSDKSGNARHFVQSTGTAQPSTGLVTQNGRNVLGFDGGDSLANATASNFTFMSNGTNYIAAIVMRFTTASRGFMGNAQGDSGQRGVEFYGAASNALQHNVYIGSGTTRAISNAGSAFGTSFRLLTILSDPDNATAAERSAMHYGTASAQKNNTQTGTPSATAPQARFRIGATIGDVASFPMTGNVAEVILVSGANATEANRVALVTYLTTKWGL